MDFNAAPQQDTSRYELIPNGTILPVQITIRPGGSGENGWLKRSSGETPCLMVDAEFVVLEGKYAKRKFWTLMVVDGQTEGQQKGAQISVSKLRAMLESARGIKPSDDSPSAVEQRRVTGYGDFDGLRFWASVGIEKGKEGYKDKNVFAFAITPDRPEWRKLDQVTKTAGFTPVGQAAAAVVNAARPAWAS